MLCREKENASQDGWDSQSMPGDPQTTKERRQPVEPQDTDCTAYIYGIYAREIVAFHSSASIRSAGVIIQEETASKNDICWLSDWRAAFGYPCMC